GQYLTGLDVEIRYRVEAPPFDLRASVFGDAGLDIPLQKEGGTARASVGLSPTTRAVAPRLGTPRGVGTLGWKVTGQSRPCAAPGEPFRLGAVMGDTTGTRPGEVCFYEDRQGRWLVLWGQRRDLYLAVSTDRGRTWAPPRALPPPVNSAHTERQPLLTQD